MSIGIDQLTGNEQAVLLALMAECRPVPNPELAQLGPKLEKPSRDKLLRYRLIEVVSQRPIVIDLSDDGWAMCQRIIEAGEVPPKSSSQGKALYTVLRSLSRYFAAQGLAPNAVFAPEDVSEEGEAPVPTSPAPSGVESKVRDAYARLVARPGGWVGLARLRSELSHVPRHELDSVLRQMFRMPGVNLVPADNQKVLTGEDRDASIIIGDDAKHLIAIQS